MWCSSHLPHCQLEVNHLLHICVFFPPVESKLKGVSVKLQVELQVELPKDCHMASIQREYDLEEDPMNLKVFTTTSTVGIGIQSAPEYIPFMT